MFDIPKKTHKKPPEWLFLEIKYHLYYVSSLKIDCAMYFLMQNNSQKSGYYVVKPSHFALNGFFVEWYPSFDNSWYEDILSLSVYLGVFCGPTTAFNRAEL